MFDSYKPIRTHITRKITYLSILIVKMESELNKDFTKKYDMIDLIKKTKRLVYEINTLLTSFLKKHTSKTNKEVFELFKSSKKTKFSFLFLIKLSLKLNILIYKIDKKIKPNKKDFLIYKKNLMKYFDEVEKIVTKKN